MNEDSETNGNTDLDVRIVKLEPMRVAWALGFGTEPEQQAWDKLLPWARENGLLETGEEHLLYGFNNPNPSPGSPNYGYEVWIKVGPEVASDDPEIRFKDVPAALYAVTRCDVPKGDFDVIGRKWQQLVAWREQSAYRCAEHQCLEESLLDAAPELEFALDLMLPIAE
ncbi:MAG: GyrI-like domain-containing protein, partial [Anaerolineae bacterium]|jgi:DNA gyrase inhibitor GyrI